MLLLLDDDTLARVLRHCRGIILPCMRNLDAVTTSCKRVCNVTRGQLSYSISLGGSRLPTGLTKTDWQQPCCIGMQFVRYHNLHRCKLSAHLPNPLTNIVRKLELLLPQPRALSCPAQVWG
jgi:hypothetical protein